MSKRFIITTVVFAATFCLSFFLGCTKKDISEKNARESAEWVKDAVLYEVSIRSFSKEGTFKALESRLPGLKKIGVSIVSLMPIHPIGELNKRGVLGSPYAVKDFYGVNSEFGTLDDFKSLVNTIHRQGLKIIIGFPAGSAAWDNQLLMEHPEWFVHNEEGAIVSPRPDWIDVAQLDYNQHELRKYMIMMMKYWVKEIGIDGFRCSASELVPTGFWEIVRKELDKIKPVIMISESSLPEHHLKAFDLTYSWSLCDMLDPILNGKASAQALKDSLITEDSRFPKGSMHLRCATAFENNEDGEYIPLIEKFSRKSAKAAIVLAFTLPGVPCIFNGEEAENNRRLNLFNKTEIDWSNGSNLTEFFEHLCALHKGHRAVRYGSYINVANSDSINVCSFIRSSGIDTVLVIINFANEKKEVNFRMLAGSSGIWIEQFSNVSFAVKDSYLSAALQPLDFLILVPAMERK